MNKAILVGRLTRDPDRQRILYHVLYLDVLLSSQRSIFVRECVSLFPDVSRQEVTRIKMV